MAHDEWRKNLRIAVAHHDAAAIRRLLDDPLPEDGLQHAGDAALSALEAEPETTAAIAGRVAEALRDRLWDGDEELANQIDVALDRRAATLTPLVLDLDLFADALTAPAGSIGYLDLHSGAVVTETMLDLGEPEDDMDVDDESRWLAVGGEGSDEPYRDMQHFIATITDPDLAEHLTKAIQGRGAFRRFYGTIATVPNEHTRWQRYSDDARLGRARSWLAEHGYQPASPTTNDSP